MPLYVVATPIGNLGDITLRALDVLKEVDVIGVETHSVAKKLLSAYGISGKKLILVREDGKEHSYLKIKSFLDKNISVALISDAGTPGISDPGNGIVDRLLREGYEVIPIPGPSAVTTLLSVFPVRAPWVFLGFLPKKKGKRIKVLKTFYESDINIVFLETPYKILDTLSILVELMPNVELCIGREITKRYEEFLVGTPQELLTVLESRNNIKGEMTVAVRVNK